MKIVRSNIRTNSWEQAQIQVSYKIRDRVISDLLRTVHFINHVRTPVRVKLDEKLS